MNVLLYLILQCACMSYLAPVPLSAPFRTDSPADSPSLRTRILLKIKAALEDGFKVHDLNEDNARKTLTRAHQMALNFLAHEDTKNAAIARQAADLAQQTIDKIHELRQLDKERLDAINRALNQKFGDKAVAVPLILRGPVFKVTAAGQVPFDGTSPLIEGETLSTGEGGYLELEMEDGAQIRLGGSSYFLFQKRESCRSIYRFTSGHLRSTRDHSESQTPACEQQQFQLPHGILTARGTDFTIDVVADSAVITVFDGNLEIQRPGSEQTILLKRGERLELSANGAPGKPSSFTRDSIVPWWK